MFLKFNWFLILKRRKSINEDDPESKCAIEPFEYNNDYINNDSDVNEDILHTNFSSLEPIITQENNDIQRHSISSIIEKNINEFLESEFQMNEEKLHGSVKTRY